MKPVYRMVVGPELHMILFAYETGWVNKRNGRFYTVRQDNGNIALFKQVGWK